MSAWKMSTDGSNHRTSITADEELHLQKYAHGRTKVDNMLAVKKGMWIRMDGRRIKVLLRTLFITKGPGEKKTIQKCVFTNHKSFSTDSRFT